MVDGILPLLSPFGGGEGRMGSRGNEETGNRRQETGDGFKPFLPMYKTSTPGPTDHPRQRAEIQ